MQCDAIFTQWNFNPIFALTINKPHSHSYFAFSLSFSTYMYIWHTQFFFTSWHKHQAHTCFIGTDTQGKHTCSKTEHGHTLTDTHTHWHIVESEQQRMIKKHIHPISQARQFHFISFPFSFSQTQTIRASCVWETIVWWCYCHTNIRDVYILQIDRQRMAKKQNYFFLFLSKFYQRNFWHKKTFKQRRRKLMHRNVYILFHFEKLVKLNSFRLLFNHSFIQSVWNGIVFVLFLSMCRQKFLMHLAFFALSLVSGFRFIRWK